MLGCDLIMLLLLTYTSVELNLKLSSDWFAVSHCDHKWLQLRGSLLAFSKWHQRQLLRMNFSANQIRHEVIISHDNWLFPPHDKWTGLAGYLLPIVERERCGMCQKWKFIHFKSVAMGSGRRKSNLSFIWCKFLCNCGRNIAWTAITSELMGSQKQINLIDCRRQNREALRVQNCLKIGQTFV